MNSNRARQTASLWTPIYRIPLALRPSNLSGGCCGSDTALGVLQLLRLAARALTPERPGGLGAASLPAGVRVAAPSVYIRGSGSNAFRVALFKGVPYGPDDVKCVASFGPGPYFSSLCEISAFGHFSQVSLEMIIKYLSTSHQISYKYVQNMIHIGPSISNFLQECM